MLFPLWGKTVGTLTKSGDMQVFHPSWSHAISHIRVLLVESSQIVPQTPACIISSNPWLLQTEFNTNISPSQEI